MKLIDKDAIVAEIEKQIELGKFKCQQSKKNNDYESHVAWLEHIATCGKILSFIDTLEVKEVDLDEEISFQWCKFLLSYKEEDSFVKIARHFFALGLKAQKGE